MDFIPNKRAQRYLWWKNLSDNITVEGPKFGLTGPEVTAAKAVADDMIAKMDATDAAQSALSGARESEKTATTADEAAIRAKVRNWKTLPGYAASGSEGVLKLKGTEAVFDPGSFKPALRISIEGGQIIVEFTKGGADAVVIYSRLRGTQGWTKLGVDTSSPYNDTRPLAQAGVPETREYMGRGYLDDEEIGLDSDIASIVFGG